MAVVRRGDVVLCDLNPVPISFGASSLQHSGPVSAAKTRGNRTAEARTPNPDALARKPLRYEKLDQLTQELLLGVR